MQRWVHHKVAFGAEVLRLGRWPLVAAVRLKAGSGSYSKPASVSRRVIASLRPAPVRLGR